MATPDFTIFREIMLDFSILETTWIVPGLVALLTTFLLCRTDFNKFKETVFPVMIGWHTIGLSQNFVFMLVAGLIYVQEAMSMDVIGGGVRVISGAFDIGKRVTESHEEFLNKRKKSIELSLQRDKYLTGYSDTIWRDRLEQSLAGKQKDISLLLQREKYGENAYHDTFHKEREQQFIDQRKKDIWRSLDKDKYGGKYDEALMRAKIADGLGKGTLKSMKGKRNVPEVPYVNSKKFKSMAGAEQVPYLQKHGYTTIDSPQGKSALNVIRNRYAKGRKVATKYTTADYIKNLEFPDKEITMVIPKERRKKDKFEGLADTFKKKKKLDNYKLDFEQY